MGAYYLACLLFKTYFKLRTLALCKNIRRGIDNTDLLPFDHHELAGLVAPRGLIVIDNSDYEWLGPWSAWGCMNAGRLIYDALGVKDNMGYSSVGNHSHCYFPDTLDDSLYAFFDRFLLDETDTSTDYFTTNGAFNGTVWDPSYWINWTTPDLS